MKGLLKYYGDTQTSIFDKKGTNMNDLDIKNIQIGDRVRFKACTRHSNTEAVRLVTGFTPGGKVKVSYHGWTGFVLKNSEIIEHIPNTGFPFEVIVGNIGNVYSGSNYMQACSHYTAYVNQSKGDYGRAAGEDVTMLHNGEIKKEFIGSAHELHDEQWEDSPVRSQS